MGKEREEDERRCPCGNGRVVRRSLRHDGPYGRATFDWTVECGACQEVYNFHFGSTNGTVTVVLKADSDRQAQLSSRASQARDEFESAVLAPLRNTVEAVARAAGRTVEAWFPALQGPMNLSGGVAELRKSVKQSGGFAGWLKQNVNASNAERLCASFQVDLPVAGRLANLREREAERAAFRIRATRVFD